MSIISSLPKRRDLTFLILTVFSSNYQVIDIYYDEYFSYAIALDKQEIVGFGHFDADLMKILSYLRIPCLRHLLEVVERLLKLAYCLWVCA